MDAASVKSHYPTVINSIKTRLIAADRQLNFINENQDDGDNWFRLDAVALQVRKVCELMVLGSTLAHLQEGTELDPKHWRPKDAFNEIGKFNAYPLPIPLQLYFSVDDEGSKQLTPAMKPMPLSSLSKVYGQCGNLLHVPSAKRVLDENVAPFEWDKFRAWVNDLIRLVRGHALLLPAIQTIIVCRWSGVPDEVPQIILAEGDGEAVLNVSNLKDFDLLSA